MASTVSMVMEILLPYSARIAATADGIDGVNGDGNIAALLRKDRRIIL
jgi:hypothetical protein